MVNYRSAPSHPPGARAFIDLSVPHHGGNSLDSLQTPEVASVVVPSGSRDLGDAAGNVPNSQRPPRASRPLSATLRGADDIWQFLAPKRAALVTSEL